MIGIICAMEEEVSEIIKSMSDKSEKSVCGVNFIQGTLCNKNCVVSLCGVGKVHSAMCTQTMILTYKPDFIVNIGVAGGTQCNINVGDIIIADSVLQHDFDVSPFRPRGEISDIGITNIPCSKNINNKILCALKDLKDVNVHSGIIMTGDQFINEESDRKRLKSLFNGIACEMEGASIGQVCYINNIEFSVIRIISDQADGTSNIDFERFIKNSSKLCSDLICKLLSTI